MPLSQAKEGIPKDKGGFYSAILTELTPILERENLRVEEGDFGNK